MLEEKQTVKRAEPPGVQIGCRMENANHNLRRTVRSDLAEPGRRGAWASVQRSQLCALAAWAAPLKTKSDIQIFVAIVDLSTRSADV